MRCIIGDVNDAIAVVTGYDIIWGERISREERALYAAGLVFGSGSMYRKGLGMGSAASFREAGDAVVAFRDAQKITRGHRGAIQAHHILEARHLKNWGMADLVRDAPPVVMSKAQHDFYTGQLRQGLPYRIDHQRAQVWEKYQKVYADHPEWLGAIRPFFR